LSDLPPATVVQPPGSVRGLAGWQPNYKKSLLRDSHEPSRPTSVGIVEGETGLLALVGAQPSRVSSQPVQVDLGIPSFHFSVGLDHCGGELIHIPAGARATQ
ncbi:hypothetical protein A2U01_0069021, partial [Trifolium medium]|nr:hypothetical protein [Trifolium medium]